MICDLLLGAPPEGLAADVCIVGAGAAGITLAVELAHRGKTVVVLEGGGRSVEKSCQSPYLGCTAALPHRGLHDGRVRALGGTTTLWGGQIMELDDLDFEARPWVSESGWPFSKSTLKEFYRRATALEGLTSAIPDDEAVWARVGVQRPQFDGVNSAMSRWCPEPNFAILHHEALQSPAITVWTHANAAEVLRSGEHVTGIRCKTQQGGEAIFRAREYCFCMGAIESSRFFLQPTSDTLPWNQSGLLGQHFQDHIDCDAAIIEPSDSKRFHDIFDAVFLSGFKYNPKLKLDVAQQRDKQLLQACATFYSSSDMQETAAGIKQTVKSLMRGRHEQVSRSELAQVARHLPMVLQQAYRYGVRHRAYHPKGAQIRMRVHCEQQPASPSSITLCSERDELGLLRTRLSWTISKDETRTISEFVNVAASALRGIAEVRPTFALDGDGDRLASHCEDSFHHMGGMRMHDSPLCGVVDTNLKLHGTSNLFVCSSAVFPTSGSSNPTHTLLALTVRLAHHLAPSAG